ncbi:Golgi transport complex family protein [Heracleum sosnowskyi]|uniref:Golgi transport complex family protein n=1 Tax=Heracleum sosnowskyi TaxID=360622 RepID=A0AAD8IN62_9APIA|nr:Golgi transport complex family protein [Heracleum sosnowskyi]
MAETEAEMAAVKQVNEITTPTVAVNIDHPFAFHVSGPRKVSSPNWRDLLNSSWKDGNYKRTVIACFIQAVYLLELDRQENKSEQTALAAKWWIPFKYKLSQTLIDDRDGSIYGAILEWDRSAALADFILVRPSGAPRAVLVLRGTLLKSLTFRRDIEDDLRFLAWESLKGSVRFNGALEALKSIADKYGSNNVCIAGHSLGAGFALQVGKALAKQGIYVETHLFNPPSVSLAMSLKNISERAGFAWKRIRAMLPYATETQGSGDEGKTTCTGLNKWMPHLYVNTSDYICCYYTDPAGAEVKQIDKENVGQITGQAAAAKLFVMSKGKQRFLEAHGLEQWWADDLELQQAVSDSKLISKQLKSLYSLQASQQMQGKPQVTETWRGLRAITMSTYIQRATPPLSDQLDHKMDGVDEEKSRVCKNYGLMIALKSKTH